MVKPRLYNEECATKFAAQYTLNRVLKEALKLLHPVMPFITEKVYKELYHNDESIMISEWPIESKALDFEKETEQIEKLKEIIIGTEMIQKLGFGDEIKIQENKENIPQNAMSVIADDIEVYIPFENLVDLKAERERLENEREKLEKEVERGKNMLSNQGFVSKAPESKIKEEKEKLAKYEEMLAKVEERLKTL